MLTSTDLTKQIHKQLQAPIADQGHVSQLSYRAQRDLSLLRDHKPIKPVRHKGRMRVAQLQQQQHAQPDSPGAIKARFRFQPQPLQGGASAAAAALSRGQQKEEKEERDEHPPPPPPRPAQRGSTSRAAASPQRGGGKKTAGRAPPRSGLAGAGAQSGLAAGADDDAAPGSTLARGDAKGGDGDDQHGEYGEVDFYGRREYLERHRKERMARIRQLREEKRLKKMKKGAPPHCHIWHNPNSEEVAKIPMQFPGNTLQDSLRDIVSFSAGAHHVTSCHDAPALAAALPEVCLPHDTKRGVSRRASRGAHARDHPSQPRDDDADHLPALPNPPSAAAGGGGGSAAPLSATLPGASSPHRPDASPRTALTGAAPSVWDRPPTEPADAPPAAGDPAEEGAQPPLRTPADPAVTATQSSSAGAAAGGSGAAVRSTRLDPMTPAPAPAATEPQATEDDEAAHHGHQLFANNCAGIRAIIAEMSDAKDADGRAVRDKDGRQRLPRLDLPKERPGGRRRHASPHGDAKAEDGGRSRSVCDVRGADGAAPPRGASCPPGGAGERAQGVKFAPGAGGGSREGGSESDDEWEGESDDGEQGEAAEGLSGGLSGRAGSPQQSSRSGMGWWQRAMMIGAGNDAWQGPLDLRENETGSSSSGDDDNYDPNCTICRMYEERGRMEIARDAGGRTAADNPYLQKTQEWKNLVYSTKLQISLRLHDALDERQATKEYVMQSPYFIARLGRTAETNARQWEMGRFTNPYNDDKSGMMPSIWSRASSVLRLERHRTAQCILLYSRMLMYLERIGGPATQGQVDLVNKLRELLIHHCRPRVTRRLFFDLLRAIGPTAIESRDNMKILHFLRIELSLSSDDLIRFIRRGKNKAKGWAMTRDLQILADKLKKREQTTRAAK